MNTAPTDAHPTTRTDPAGPSSPTADTCPAGGNHAPIPVQGKNYNVCAKCGATC